jgi:glutamyl-Q tRNA(Asp) synthetase
MSAAAGEGLDWPPPVFRFAPSPNGYLHLGHALSALINFDTAQRHGGRFLLRIEDIDLSRARPEFEKAIFEDLDWLGLEWERPVLRQSERFETYGAALDELEAWGSCIPRSSPAVRLALSWRKRRRREKRGRAIRMGRRSIPG